MHALLQDTYRAVDTDDASHASIASELGSGPMDPLLCGSGSDSVANLSVLSDSVAILPTSPASKAPYLAPLVMPSQSVPSVVNSALADGVIRRCHTVEEAGT